MPFVKLLDELSSYSWRKLGSAVFLRCHLSCLKLRVCQIKSQNLTVSYCFWDMISTSIAVHEEEDVAVALEDEYEEEELG